jgi:hypothetical protein
LPKLAELWRNYNWESDLWRKDFVETIRTIHYWVTPV